MEQIMKNVRHRQRIKIANDGLHQSSSPSNQKKNKNTDAIYYPSEYSIAYGAEKLPNIEKIMYSPVGYSDTNFRESYHLLKHGCH